MRDKHRFDLMEYNKWSIAKVNDDWVLTGEFGYVISNSVRNAFNKAVEANVEWQWKNKNRGIQNEKMGSIVHRFL